VIFLSTIISNPFTKEKAPKRVTMAFTSIQAAYLDAANWQQHEVNHFKVFFFFNLVLPFVILSKRKIIQKIKRKKKIILVTFIYYTSS
jgi:NhaP-type Na+/H+ or K+/H+ antiporter